MSLKVVYLPRWNVLTHRFGYHHRTTQLKILYTTAFTSRRIRRSFSTVTKFITTRRGIRIRTHQLISFGSHADKCIPATGFPSSLSASWETQRHVPNQATSLMPWIGIIGRSVRGTYKRVFLLCRCPSPVSSLTFYSNSSQPSLLSGHPRRRTAAVACDLTVALGV